MRWKRLLVCGWWNKAVSWSATSKEISEGAGGFSCSHNLECSAPSRWRKSWQPLVCWPVPTRGLGVSLGARGNAWPLLWSWWTTPLSCSLMNPPGTSRPKIKHRPRWFCIVERATEKLFPSKSLEKAHLVLSASTELGQEIIWFGFLVPWVTAGTAGLWGCK